ncbi:hypothetical protein Gotur_011491, partial [Gossypium turneri]
LLYKLKVLNLKEFENLIKTPDFITALNLEILILEDCIRLVDVHPSIGVLKRLKLLNLRGCRSPKNLHKFSEIDCKLENLLERYLDDTGIKELPFFNSTSQKA